MLAFTHEIGHNFDSDHTQCYKPAVDECYSCNSNKRSCPNPSIAGQGAATIMSYCHHCGGGYDNIAYTFGGYYDESAMEWVADPTMDAFGFSDRAERVPEQMYQHVRSRANSCVDVLTACTSDTHCDDGLYCNGVENCIDGWCYLGTSPPCGAGIPCSETGSGTGECETCTSNEECNDFLYCTGAETCNTDGVCVSAGNPCALGEVCVEEDNSYSCVQSSCAISGESCKKTQCCSGLLCYVGYKGGPQCG
jgi:hypothetical protein